MSNHKNILLLLTLGLFFLVIGCTAPENKGSTGKNPPVTGGIAVGMSPKLLYAERGQNISFNVELSSTENADDSVTITLNSIWFNRTLKQDVKAGVTSLIQIYVTVPLEAGNTSLKVEAISRNLNATSSTSGAILINNIGG